MIFLTGDLHGVNRLPELGYDWWPLGRTLMKTDYLIVLGDFGLIWKDDRQHKYWLDWLDKKPWTTLFVDGNHECVSKDTEVLTNSGWVTVSKVFKSEEYLLANYNIQTKEIFFDKPLNKYKTFKETAINIEGKNVKQIVSRKHDVIINNKKIKAECLLNKQIQEKEFTLRGVNNNLGVDILDGYIELITWVIMDGTIIDYSKYNANSKKCTIQFHLSLENKIDELKHLLSNMQIPFSVHSSERTGANVKQPTYIRIYSDYARKIKNMLGINKTIPDNWESLNAHQLEIFLDTLTKTDGTKINHGNNGIVWRTINKKNVDIIQEACIKNNTYFVYKKFMNMSGFKNGKQQYICRIFKEKRLNNFVHIDEIKYNDDMYCFTMPNGTLITRLEGKVVFTGNCFNLLNSYPVTNWCGGKVHMITPSIIHLMRGQVFNLQGKKFFTFGGATSIDKEHRKPYVSWWPEEVPSQHETLRGVLSLVSVNNKVDYVLTHTCPNEIVKVICGSKMNYELQQPDPVCNILDYFYELLEFDHWYFGHFHEDRQINNKFTVMYEDIKRIL